jgi:hypothetical protein
VCHNFLILFFSYLHKILIIFVDKKENFLFSTTLTCTDQTAGKKIPAYGPKKRIGIRLNFLQKNAHCEKFVIVYSRCYTGDSLISVRQEQFSCIKISVKLSLNF